MKYYYVAYSDDFKFNGVFTQVFDNEQAALAYGHGLIDGMLDYALNDGIDLHALLDENKKVRAGSRWLSITSY